MQKQIRQERTDYTPLRRSCYARNNAAILHLFRRLQPALDVEQHPRAIRMMADGLEQQLPIDAVEEALDVEIEHPVVAPAAHTSCAHGINCRSAGPLAIGTGNRRGIPARDVAAGNDGRLPGRRDPLPSGCPTGACRRSLSVFPLAVPVEESSSLRTSDSKACRGC